MAYDGTECPHCGVAAGFIYPSGDNTTWIGPDAFLVRSCQCGSCGATWNEFLQGVEFADLDILDPVQELVEAAEAFTERIGSCLPGSFNTFYKRLKTASDAVKYML